MKRKLYAASMASALTLGVASSAEASLVLALNDPGTAGVDVIVVDDTDGGVGTSTSLGLSTILDTDARDGVVAFTGTVGAFSTSTLGFSKPELTGNMNRIDLFSFSQSTGAGILEIMLTDTDFFGDAESLIRFIGGTTNSSVSAQAFADPDNDEFGTDFATVVLNFTPVAFSGEAAVATPGMGDNGLPYSISSKVIIEATAAGQLTSFDNEVRIPEPATLALMGFGLAGFGYTRRRRLKN